MKVMCVFGTRPEAIKMSPLVKELQKHNIESYVTVTAQHREMLDQVLDIFDVHPDFDLNIMSKGQTLAEITTKSMNGLDKIFKQVKPDLILVHGDTTTTFSASLAAYYNQIKIGHVEAGLRTHDKYSPFPEEANRQLAGVLADIHFAPTQEAHDNLINEGKPKEKIYITGNTVIDALKTTVNSNYKHKLLNKRTILLTCHRRENIDKLEGIFRAINQIAEEYHVHIVYPVHMNPIIREKAKMPHPNIHLIDPLGVIDFHNFMAKSYLILTDSGGIQEEAPSLGVPVLVLRDTTERPEGVEAGTLKLVGTRQEDIYRATKELLDDETEHKRMSRASNPYGDGEASKRIVDICLQNQVK